MDREEAFEFLDRTARGIAEMFGSTCETLVHDMGDPRHPILSIYNGHVSGRTVGSTLDILGTAKELDEDALVTDFVNLYATTPSGQQIKSSTFHLIGEGYNLALGINFDYSSLVYANRILVDLMSAEADLQSALWHGGDSRLANIVADVIIPLSARAGEFLDTDGVFLCSGIIDTRAGEVEAALERNGLAVFERREQNGWVALAARAAR